MKKLVSKAEVRQQLEQQVKSYLEHGGNVQSVPRGTTGRDPQARPTYLSGGLFNEPRGTRTPVPEVVAAIEERRSQMIKRSPVKKRSRLPARRRKVIYDDFGEPLRHVWVDD